MMGGWIRVKIPCEFLCNMCNLLFKIKTKSCVMLLLRHAAGYILFLIDDAQCIGEGVELGMMPELWINF